MTDTIRMNADRRVSRMPIAPVVGSAVTVAHPSQRETARLEALRLRWTANRRAELDARDAVQS